ncbi:hypothetical protein C7120_07545 [Prevotella sp. oral taxon 376]|nr:hypothetical protein C7120_07545 [Prevotella sp. oral taxon 376]
MIRKMAFRAFSENSFKEKDVVSKAEYLAVLNPTSFVRTLSVKSEDKKNQPLGSVNDVGKGMGFESEVIKFDLLIDGTGLVDENRSDVKTEIDKFLEIVYSNPEMGYKAPYVGIEYAGILMLCKLTSLEIVYQLFHQDGTPLRAKLSCSFKTVSRPKPSQKKKPPKAKQECRPICECTCASEVTDQASKLGKDTIHEIK